MEVVYGGAFEGLRDLFVERLMLLAELLYMRTQSHS
jgi:hypothetical protein